MRLLSLSGFNTPHSIASADPRRLEVLLSRNPPVSRSLVAALRRPSLKALVRQFGDKLVADARKLPALNLTISQEAKKKTSKGLSITVNIEIGLRIREGIHTKKKTNGSMIFAAVLTVLSDKEFVDFRRMP